MDTLHVGKAEVINCKFEYECPRDWFKLATTDDPSIRHCSACSKEVYFCRDVNQLVLLKQYIPDACAAMHSSKVTTIDGRKIRMGLPRVPEDNEKQP